MEQWLISAEQRAKRGKGFLKKIIRKWGVRLVQTAKKKSVQLKLPEKKSPHVWVKFVAVCISLLNRIISRESIVALWPPPDAQYLQRTSGWLCYSVYFLVLSQQDIGLKYPCLLGCPYFISPQARSLRRCSSTWRILGLFLIWK